MRAHAPAQEPTGRLAHEEDRHTPFWMYRRFYYLKVATISLLIAVAIYLVDVPFGERYGGTWAGYVLGTVGALLILWLMWFGYRKRRYQESQGKLEAWLSGHVYLGMALIVVATLHTGFHFGWNIHTLAYALMLLVIFSGMFGMYCYLHYPRLITDNRVGMTMPQAMARIAVLNDELRASAMTLEDVPARLVREAVDRTEIGGAGWRQISGNYPSCTTAKAIAGFDALETQLTPDKVTLYRQVRVLLDEKAALLGRVRRDISYKAMMDAWLFFHVPLSFGLLAALSAHVISVFFYW